jgi:opacity protein-like surface antigen
LLQASAVVLAGTAAAMAQGFENMDMNYTTTTTTTASNSSNEPKFSIFAGLGAGFPIGGWDIGSSDKTVLRTGGTFEVTETDDEYLNFGSGLKVDLGAAYRFIEHVDARASFIMSFGIPYTDVEMEDRDETGSPVDVTTETFTYHRAQFGFRLMLVPRFRAFDLFDMYVGAGLGLYFTSASFEREFDNSTTAVHYEEEVDIDTKASLPFIGMLGAEYPINKHLVVFLDATYEAQNVTVQEYKVEETNFPAGMATTSQKFEKDATDRPAPPKIPGSNWQIRLGVRVPLF